jgi:hypothetical protein
LKYLAKGLRPTRESQQKLQDELHDALPNVRSVVVLPVVDGFSVELEIDDMAPFTRSSIEPYVAEHVLPEAVAIGCRTSEPVDLLLLKAHFA